MRISELIHKLTMHFFFLFFQRNWKLIKIPQITMGKNISKLKNLSNLNFYELLDERGFRIFWQ
jgi:hypothetical protein